MPSSEPALPAAPEHKSAAPPRHQRQLLTIVLVLLTWTYLYNVAVKRQGLGRAFFQVLDTISDDFVMGSLLTVGIGAAIVVVFSGTKLYGQIVANTHAFPMLEELVHSDLRAGRFKQFFWKLLNFRDLPPTPHVCPARVSSILGSFAFIYVMSWIYVVLFSETLFFAAWSSGVDLPVNEQNVLLMPTLALAIPFSARVMAYVRYPYAQDYADFMPAAAFALIVITTLGFIFESSDQRFFLKRVCDDRLLLAAFAHNGIFLAFIPVFFEAMFWMAELFLRPKPPQTWST